MSTRHRLPNRRASIVVGFMHEGMRWTARGSFFPDGQLAELFLTGGKVGSTAQASAHDAAVTLSIGLQYGVPLEALRAALLKDAVGQPAGPLGAGIDAVLSAASEVAAA